MADVRVSKKSLKQPDEFLTFSSKMIAKILQYKKIVTIAIGVIAASFAVISCIHYFSEKAENEGSILLNRTMEQYSDSVKESGFEKAYERVADEFQKTIGDYSGRNCGKFARLIFASVCYRAGKLDKAAYFYAKAKEDFEGIPTLRNIALGGLGLVYEQQKAFVKAVEVFEKISGDPEVIMADETLFTLGRLYGLIEKKEKGIEVMKQLIDNYPDSIYKELVLEKQAG